MDITSDSTHSTVYHVFSRGVPDYVMQGTPLTKEAAAELPDGLFADGFNRRYPVDSKASTWVSAAYFARTSASDGYDDATAGMVRDSILKAAEAYGIRDDVEKVMERETPREPVVKKASDDMSNYGWPEERKYPMFDDVGAKLASDYFSENAYMYPPAVRHSIARRIMSKCAEYGVEPSRVVSAEAFVGLSRRDAVGAALADRAMMSKDAELGRKLTEATRVLVSLPGAAFQDQAVKFAEFLEDFDLANGFHRQYGTRFESPCMVFFGTTVKEAKDILDDTAEIGGQAFSVGRLAELPVEVFTGALGEDFGERVKSAEGGIDAGLLSDELHSMPEPDKRALFKALREYAD